MKVIDIGALMATHVDDVRYVEWKCERCDWRRFVPVSKNETLGKQLYLDHMAQEHNIRPRVRG